MMELTLAQRTAVTRVIAVRYRRAGNAEKAKILDELLAENEHPDQYSCRGRGQIRPATGDKVFGKACRREGHASSAAPARLVLRSGDPQLAALLLLLTRGGWLLGD